MTEIVKFSYKENPSEYLKEYYQKNKEVLREKANTKLYCDCCKKHVIRGNWSRHLKCTRHVKLNKNYMSLHIDENLKNFIENTIKEKLENYSLLHD